MPSIFRCADVDDVTHLVALLSDARVTRGLHVDSLGRYALSTFEKSGRKVCIPSSTSDVM